ncbi:hypothetical protein DFH06DRAFT_1166286 [Mycena polygramma]|nr:hypothetical protein DFH06DRAFT_1166286 [Mycena polygramma]
MDTMCSAAGCIRHADLICSVCKSFRYCGEECQKRDWKTHKGTCKILANIEKMRALSGLPERKIVRPPTTHCTGCELVFRDDSRDGKPITICPDCGYVACESCACHNCRGTCYCDDSNFGYKYCDRVPEWYHYGARSGRKYRGDNHPSVGGAKDHGVPASQWEKEPRRCGNCGETKLCLIPGYICNSWMCQ